MRPLVAVVGGGLEDPRGGRLAMAEEVGVECARRGAVVLCGGLGGVMEAACRGAKRAGGLTVGLLPGEDSSAANPFVDLALATGLGEARNAVVVRAADAVVAVGGEHGTLSELALALKFGRPVVALGSWRLTRPDGSLEEALVEAASPAEAVATALGALSDRG